MAFQDNRPLQSRSDDLRLIAGASSGDADARAALDRRLENLPGLVKACHIRMGSPLSAADLDDAIQETSLTAWRRRKGFRGESSLDTWLYGIARICILQQLGARRRTSGRECTMAPELDAELDGPGPGTQADTGIQRVIRSTLQQQGTTIASIVRRKNVEGESFAHIADELQMEQATVKTRYYRSLPKLRSVLGKLWRDTSA